MRFSKIVLITLAFYMLSPQVSAQTAQTKAETNKDPQENLETKVFPIKYVDPTELTRVLSMFTNSVSYSGGALRVLSVRAPKEIMPAIEDTIKRLDVPMARKDAEL